METIRHIFGLCNDNHSHFDLLDFLSLGAPISGIVIYYRLLIGAYIKIFLDKIKNLYKKFF